MREQILRVVREALKGSRRVRITFDRKAKNEAEQDLEFFSIMSLIAMDDAGISLSNNDKNTLRMFTRFGCWQNDKEHIMVITLTDEFEEERFVNKMHHVLKNIEIAN